MVDNYAESDEAFARRLQAQEMGNFTTHGHSQADAQTPLVTRQGDNPTVINARYNEVQSSRAAMYMVFMIYGPQVLASIIVLSIHWEDPNICDQGHTNRWKSWAILAAFRMAAFIGMVYVSDAYRQWLQDHREHAERLKNFRNALEAFGLVWFVVGNIWLFGDDTDICRHPQRSPIYNLCVSLLVLNYIQICFPCIVAILLIPVFCFCMPCLIRLLARLQDPRASAGASEAAIESLPEVVIDSSHLRVGQDNTCPICLSEMALGESARVLSCSHIFHKQCVDEWLRVNASCPTCRKRIIDGPDPSGAGGSAQASGSGGGSGGGSSTGAGAGGAGPAEVAMYTFSSSGISAGSSGRSSGGARFQGSPARISAGSSNSNSNNSGVGGGGGSAGYALIPNSGDSDSLHDPSSLV